MELCPDRQLSALIHERLELQQRLAHVLSRVGASHDQRAKINAKRALARKAHRASLRENAEKIAARCIALYTP